MELVTLCRALGDETRMRIYRLLLQRGYCVGALARKLGISESAVSQHLKLMREAGLIAGEKRGYHVHYVIDHAAAEDMAASLLSLTKETPSPCTPAYGGCDEAEYLHSRRAPEKSEGAKC